MNAMALKKADAIERLLQHYVPYENRRLPTDGNASLSPLIKKA